ncbi:hypothetical protein VTG60DRAFT_791 [Thermothelomyces hinnuleus]
MPSLLEGPFLSDSAPNSTNRRGWCNGVAPPPRPISFSWNTGWRLFHPAVGQPEHDVSKGRRSQRPPHHRSAVADEPGLSNWVLVRELPHGPADRANPGFQQSQLRNIGILAQLVKYQNRSISASANPRSFFAQLHNETGSDHKGLKTSSGQPAGPQTSPSHHINERQSRRVHEVLLEHWRPLSAFYAQEPEPTTCQAKPIRRFSLSPVNQIRVRRLATDAPTRCLLYLNGRCLLAAWALVITLIAWTVGPRTALYSPSGNLGSIWARQAAYLAASHGTPSPKSSGREPRSIEVSTNSLMTLSANG